MLSVEYSKINLKAKQIGLVDRLVCGFRSKHPTRAGEGVDCLMLAVSSLNQSAKFDKSWMRNTFYCDNVHTKFYNLQEEVRYK